ncbi:hypothetical protein J6590_029836 [Homalodisca vitripennis]|nr:hypothetical protein J6590_029836 [Homalodisca vitripennis]
MLLDSEEGIECDGGCKHWFRRDCLNLSKTEYAQLFKDLNREWYCSRVDCKPLIEDPIVALTLIVNKLMNKIEDWEEKIEPIGSFSIGVEAIKSDVETVIAEINDRNLPLKNTILYGIPKYSDKDIKSKILHEKGGNRIVPDICHRSVTQKISNTTFRDLISSSGK